MECVTATETGGNVMARHDSHIRRGVVYCVGEEDLRFGCVDLTGGRK